MEKQDSVDDLIEVKVRRGDLYYLVKSTSELMERGVYSLDHDYMKLPSNEQAKYLERRRAETQSYQRLFRIFIDAYEKKFDPSMIGDAVCELDMLDLDRPGSD